MALYWRTNFRPWLWTALALTVLKLWLTRGQPIFALAGADHDDLLFVRLANYLTRGEWLGPYDQLTLAKGPFYSFWIAGVYWLGIPLFLAQHIAYAAACGAFVQACKPALSSACARFLVFTALLWNPMTYEARSMGRVLRQHIYVSLTLLILAGLVALYFRRQETVRRQLPWAILAGLSLGAFWITREESIWLLPSVILLLAATFRGARPRAFATLPQMRSLVVVVVSAVLPVLIVCIQNERAYGWFGTVEFRSAAFNDAYGALLRIKAGPDIPFVPVTRQAREIAYPVSPAFAELKPYLDGDVGFNWAESSQYVTHLPAIERQIGGGWFMWALRDSVSNAGHAADAGDALAYYRRLANEINAACDSGRLPSGPPRSGLLPPWREGQTKLLAHTALFFADFFVTFRGFTAFSPPSEGTPQELQFFEELTNEQLAPVANSKAEPLPYQLALNNRKINALQSIGKFFRLFMIPLFWIALTIFVLRLGDVIWRRNPTYLFILSLAAVFGCSACILINALVEVTSFPLLAICSFAQAYPLLIIFMIAALWDAIQSWIPARGFSRPDYVKTI